MRVWYYSIVDETVFQEVTMHTVIKASAKEKAIARLYDLVNLQRLLISRYGEHNYNVFGSYPTLNYTEGIGVC